MSTRGASQRSPNIFGSLLGLRSIHPPADPDPNTLRGDARSFWEHVRSEAYAYYGPAGAPKPHEAAEKTAWKAVRMHFTPTKRAWSRSPHPPYSPSPRLIPDPGDVITLGVLLEYAWLTVEGEFRVNKWEDSDPPSLFWNKHQKTLYSFPSLEGDPGCAPISSDLRSSSHMYKRWAQRKPQCLHTFSVDADLLMTPVGMGDSIAYRSDKWHERSQHEHMDDSQEYFHQFGDGVWVWQNEENGPYGLELNAVLVRGGKLDVEERGIIH